MHSVHTYVLKGFILVVSTVIFIKSVKVKSKLKLKMALFATTFAF